MKNKKIITTLMLSALVVGFGSLANAQDKNEQENRGWGRPTDGNGVEMRGNKTGWQKFGTTTPPRRDGKDGRFASSSKMMGERFGFNASSTRFVGKISNLSGSSFTISPLEMGRPGTTTATTTSFTVNLTASTTIRTGSTTASVSELSNNKLVMVFGTLDKNTNTITAKEINILPARAVENFENRRVQTPPRRGFFERMKGGMSSAMQGMLGWFHKK